MLKGKLLWPRPMHWSLVDLRLLRTLLKKTKQTKKKKKTKEVERLFLFGLENTIFFFPVHMVATALKEDINIPALTA